MNGPHQSAAGDDALFDTLDVVPEQRGVVRQLAAIQGVSSREYVTGALAQRVAADSGLELDRAQPRSMLAAVALASAQGDALAALQGVSGKRREEPPVVGAHDAEVERCARICEAYALGDPQHAQIYHAAAADIRAQTPLADLERRLFPTYVDPYAALNQPGVPPARPRH